ncbi:MAG: glutamate--tRNA ligase [Bacteroidia bacterium]|nr:glutamate--tRNA ligase [Bacteroidia bacterium]
MSTSDIRVRFAPSPTGFLHVGGLRTALYNHLFARHHGGRTILRIEDTDRSRYVEGAVENLLDTLEWAGITFDEGPRNGGPYGPYIQSERTELYRQHVDQLLAEGKAYRCFCTPEDLERSRNRQIEAKQDASYDRTCRSLSESEIREKLESDCSFTVRLKVPLLGTMQFTDLVRGEISVAYEVIDDQVLLKSDGFPTYHLANVVDDHHMRVTHVIRGEEWLPSTPKHLLLYDCFGWDAPQFAHLPLLLNQDRSKLSKRQGDVAVEDYRAKGYLPEALINFVALLGWNPGDDRELFTLHDLERDFTLDRVSKAGAVFDIDKLQWFNAQYVRSLPAETLVNICQPWLAEAGIDTADTARCISITTLLSSYLSLPSDIAPLLRPFSSSPIIIDDAESRDILDSEISRQVLRDFLAKAKAPGEWTAPAIKAMISDIQKESGIKGKALFGPIRIALTGAPHGPDLGTTAEILGRDMCIARAAAQLS